MGYSMDLADLIRYAKAYQNLGWSVQEQLDKFLSGGSSALDELNENAIDEFAGFLDMVAQDGQGESRLAIEAQTAAYEIRNWSMRAALAAAEGG